MASQLQAGETMPDIALETPDGGVVRPSDYRPRNLVLYFYPKDDTPGCTTEAQEFSQAQPDFERANTAILGVSKDSAQKHRNFVQKHGLTVDLATDAAENGLSDALGIWGEKKMYGKTFTGMHRTTYLIDGNGTIVRVWDGVKVKGHVIDVLAAARDL